MHYDARLRFIGTAHTQSEATFGRVMAQFFADMPRPEDEPSGRMQVKLALGSLSTLPVAYLERSRAHAAEYDIVVAFYVQQIRLVTQTFCHRSMHSYVCTTICPLSVPPGNVYCPAHRRSASDMGTSLPLCTCA